jgi:hypothetical protein
VVAGLVCGLVARGAPGPVVEAVEAGSAGAPADAPLAERVARRPRGTIRVATYNASLNRATAGGLQRALAAPGDPQATRIARVLRHVRPDVLLLNEFDYDARGESAGSFARHYLEAASEDAASPPLRYPYRFTAPVNTGVPSGLDLDRDGRSGGPGDALGFGAFPGQYGMVVYSRFPIDRRAARTFRQLRWASMPDAVLPPGWYDAAALALQPLSSKSHWDLPLPLPGGRRLHLLASHPTPPVFDGPEDRNGRRNHDEIRFWADYLSGAEADWIVDDRGARGGLADGASFVVLGDLNADPVDGDSFASAIHPLLGHPRIDASTAPASAGAAAAAARQGGTNLQQHGDPRFDTADFGERGAGGGNLRTDYLLPSRDLPVCQSGVYWPTPQDPEFAWVNDDTAASSDHRLVWIDVALDGRCGADPQGSDRSTPTGQ